MKQVRELTQHQRNFLKGYLSKDKHFTSLKEIELIEMNLEMKGLTIEEIIAMRNTVVVFYDNLMDNELELNGRSEIYYDFMTAMQSVTAVIDNYIYVKKRLILSNGRYGTV